MAAAASLPTFSKDTMHEDRFTELPEDVAHSIISLLPTADFFALYCSSRKCRHLCLTSPFLTFDSQSFNGGRNRAGYEYELADSLDRFLYHRGERMVQYFCLRSHVYYRPFDFLCYAIRNGVEVLHIEFTVRLAKSCIFFPPCLYSCESLRSLTINFYNPLVYRSLPAQSISFPYLNSFRNLQSLSLKFVRVVLEDCPFGEWISSWCKIKEIRFERVNVLGSINIESSCLERFEVVSSYLDNLSISGERLQEVIVRWPARLFNLSISGEKVESIDIRWGFIYSEDRTLKISAPNLKSLHWFGSWPCSIVLEKFMHLEIFSMFLQTPKADNCRILTNLLGGLSSTRELRVFGGIPKVLYQHDESPIPKLDARNLSIYICDSSDDFFPPAIVHLLKGLHHLTSLAICVSEPLSFSLKDLLPLQGHGFDMSYWESQELKFVHRLEYVGIHIIYGGDELELAKYLLKHAKQLKKMIIFLHPLSCRANERVNEFRKTTNAVVIFKELRNRSMP